MLSLAGNPITITVAVLGSWTYGAFVNDPTRAALPPPALAARTPAEPKPIERATMAAAAPATPPAVRLPAPVAPALAPPAPPVQAEPTRYRLADASGQVWEHADPAWLQSFVASRNTQGLVSIVSRPVMATPACRTGTCR